MDNLKIGSRQFQSRLIVGSGKYKSLEETASATNASGAEIITIAIRRMNIGQSKTEPIIRLYRFRSIYIASKYCWLLRCRISCKNVFASPELLDGHNFVKLEVIGDQETLYPDVRETILAAEELLKLDFEVLAYTTDDPIIAKNLEDWLCGCYASSLPIGSGLGIQNEFAIKTIVENAAVPIIVDAGLGTASDASEAMEFGCDAVLVNSAIAKAKQPILMAEAMASATRAGRLAYLAGRMEKKLLLSLHRLAR